MSEIICLRNERLHCYRWRGFFLMKHRITEVMTGKSGKIIYFLL